MALFIIYIIIVGVQIIGYFIWFLLAVWDLYGLEDYSSYRSFKKFGFWWMVIPFGWVIKLSKQANRKLKEDD